MVGERRQDHGQSREQANAGRETVQTIDKIESIGTTDQPDHRDRDANPHVPFRAAKQVDLAYRLVAGRPPKLKEMQESVAFLKTQSRREFALAMLNLNAFLYVN